MNESQMFNDSSRQALRARLPRDRDRAGRGPSVRRAGRGGPLRPGRRQVARPDPGPGPPGPCVCVGAAEHEANVTDAMALALNRKALKSFEVRMLNTDRRAAGPQGLCLRARSEGPVCPGWKSIDLLAPVARAERACYKRACASTWLHGLNLASRQSLRLQALA